MPATTHDINRVAAGIRTATADAGIALPVDYTRAVTASGLEADPNLAVTALGAGVVIHTQPDTHRRLPILLGYADRNGQWYRDGRRHPQPDPVTAAGPADGIAL